DNAALEQVAQHTTSTVGLVVDGVLAAHSTLGDGLDAARLLEAYNAAKNAPDAVEVREHVAVTGALIGPMGDAGVGYVMMRSLNRALEPARAVIWVLAGLTALLAVLLFLPSSELARRMSQPVEALVGATKQIGAGLVPKNPIERGPRELRMLGGAM